MNKKILFLTGTRADYGKLKSLIKGLESLQEFDTYIFATGMHMLAKYGMTVRELEKDGLANVYKFINQNSADSMDLILAKTIHGLSDYVKELSPDMIVVHGDRVEALAGAIVGSLNNILVAHIEGGEVSGTIDELIRHSVSKMAHLHFVSNESARDRLLQLGESNESIFVIGSPDLDIMTSPDLPSIDSVKKRYSIDFEHYAVLMYHPVTTEFEKTADNIREVVDSLIESNLNYVVIYPNNDYGSDFIVNELHRLKNNPKFRVFPSIRFEYFLTLLKNAMFMIGNSSAGVREVPFYGKLSINLGSRQNRRATAPSVINVPEIKNEILLAISRNKDKKFSPTQEFGRGESAKIFVGCLMCDKLWQTSKQKIFLDLFTND